MEMGKKKNEKYVRTGILLFLLILVTQAVVPPSAAAEILPSEAQMEDDWRRSAIMLEWYVPAVLEKGLVHIYDELNDYLYRKTGAAVEFKFTGWIEYGGVMESLYASGDSADLIFTAYWLSYSEYARRGCFYPISGLIDEYAPKTKAELGSAVLEAAEVDGELFALPVPGRLYSCASGIVFRKDIVDKYNIDLSRIRRLEDLEPVLKLVKSKQPDLVPMVLDSGNSLIYDLIGFEQAGSDSRIPGVLSNDPKDSRIYNEYESDSMMAYLKTLNKFYRAGYMVSATNLDTDRIFSSLRPNVDTSSGSYSTGGNAWIGISLGKPVITGESATYSMYSVWYNSKNPINALRIMECVNTDPYVSNLIHFGIEGEDYIRLSGNIIDIPMGKQVSDTVSSTGRDWLLGNSYLNYIWKGEDPDIYNNMRNHNLKAQPARALGFNFDILPVTMEVLNCRELISAYGDKLFSGQHDPEIHLRKLNEELKKAGADKIIEEKQRQFDAWLEDREAEKIKNTSGIKLMLGGKPLTLKYPPAFSGEVPMAPMKQFFDSLDAISGYDPASGKITARKYDKHLEITLGKTSGFLNGKGVQLDASPAIINGQVYVPAESVCTLLGYDCEWVADTKTLQMTGITDAAGISWGNLLNSGLAAADGNDQYFSMANGIFKLSEDGEKFTLLNPDPGYCLNLDKEWLYYASGGVFEDMIYSLCRMKRDGGPAECLLDEGVAYVNLMGEWLYYIRLADLKIYRMHADGQYVQKLSDFAVSSLYAADGWLYFLKSSDKELYRMRTSGTDMQKLTDTPGKAEVIIQKRGDWIYYYRKSGRQPGLYRMKTDGSGTKFISDFFISHIGSDGKNLYITDNDSLYVIDVDARVRDKVGSYVFTPINVCGDWIYYRGVYTSTKTEGYRVKTNGTVKQKIGSDGRISDVYRTDEKDMFASVPVKVQSFTSRDAAAKTAKEIEAYSNAVVQVRTFDEDGDQLASVSGFNIDSNGTIVTNFDVIEGAASIQCIFDNGNAYDVDYVLNYNKIKDVAILRLKSAKGLPVVRLGDSSEVCLSSAGRAAFTLLPETYSAGYLYGDENGSVRIELLNKDGKVLKTGSPSEEMLLNEAGFVQIKADLDAGTYYISVSADDGLTLAEPYEYCIVCAVD